MPDPFEKGFSMNAWKSALLGALLLTGISVVAVAFHLTTLTSNY